MSDCHSFIKSDICTLNILFELVLDLCKRLVCKEEAYLVVSDRMKHRSFVQR